MLSPNTMLQGRYRIVRELGRGGMGAVYEAIDQRLSRTVALKETLVDSEELLKAFEREARLLANLRHPALPKVIDHFVEGDGQYLVMEFIAGDDLAEQLQKRGRPFSPDDVTKWTEELLDALDYLHSHQPPIIHRDIKPHNLKLTPQGHVILLDFGLAKGAAGEMTRVSSGTSVIGYTPHYASLEQIQGEKTSAQSDLYSLAATLYTLLTNRVPADALKRATELINDQPDPLFSVTAANPAVPSALGGLLARSLSLRPSERPASAAAMRAALLNPALSAVAMDDEVTRVRGVNGGFSPLANAGTRPGGPVVSTNPPVIVGRPPTNQKTIWIMTAIACSLIVGLGVFVYFMMRPNDIVSTVNPQAVPSDSIPAPFNAEIGAIAALSFQDADGKTLRKATGFFVRPDEVVTTLSSIEGASRGRVALVGQSGSFEVANVAGFDPAHKLVTLKVNGAKSTFLGPGADKRTTAGEKIAVLGAASQYQEAAFYQPSFAQGAITGYQDDDQIQVSLSGGTSPGSPLLNAQGELIGVITTVSGANGNQALAMPVVYVADLAGKKQTSMTLEAAGANNAIFDFRKPLPVQENKVPDDVAARVIAALRKAHAKPQQAPPPPPVASPMLSPVEGETPAQTQPVAGTQNTVPETPPAGPDAFSNAVVTSSAAGAFNAPGAKQTAYIVDTRAGGGADNSGLKYLAIFQGDNLVTDTQLRDFNLIITTFDLNRDGINEFLLGYDSGKEGSDQRGAELLDISKNKPRVIKDFGLTYQEKCGGDGGSITAAAVFAAQAQTGQFPDFRVDNFSGPCGTETADSPAWKYDSTGKIQQKP